MHTPKETNDEINTNRNTLLLVPDVAVEKSMLSIS